MGAFISISAKIQIQSVAGLKALKPAANGRYLIKLMCKSLPYSLHLLRSTFIFLM